MTFTWEESAWMGKICSPNPCEIIYIIQNLKSNHQRRPLIFAFCQVKYQPAIHKAKEEVPIVLGSKVVRVPINFPQFC